MRALLEGILSEEDLPALRKLQAWEPRRDFTEVAARIPSFARIMDYMETCIPEKLVWEKPSYFRVCNRARAFEKHYDGCKIDGSPNHMPWCRYSLISNISEGYRGGVLRFYNPTENFKKKLFCSALIFSSSSGNNPQLHSRDRHDTGRYALLLFLATEKPEI